MEKQGIIAEMTRNIQLEPQPFLELAGKAGSDWSPFLHRRAIIKGKYDFDHEVILRNRRYNGLAGVHVITPMQIEGSEEYLLVDRGFIPLINSKQEERRRYRGGSKEEFTGLIQESMYKKIFAPSDPPTGDGKPWADQWLRVDVPSISKQLPYPVFPVFVEIMQQGDSVAELSDIVESENSGREEIFMPQAGIVENFGMQAPDLPYPIPVITKVIPPGRHLGYVYEWAFMALITICIGIVLQMRRIQLPQS